MAQLHRSQAAGSSSAPGPAHEAARPDHLVDLMEVMLALIAVGVYGYALYVCFLKGKHGFFWLGIVGLFPLLTVFLGWFPVVGALRPAKEGSPWTRRQGSPSAKGEAADPDFEPPWKPPPPPPTPDELSRSQEIAVIGRFLERAARAWIISADVKSRLLLFRDDPERAVAEATQRRAEATWGDLDSSTTKPDTTKPDIATPAPAPPPVVEPQPPVPSPRPPVAPPQPAAKQPQPPSVPPRPAPFRTGPTQPARTPASSPTPTARPKPATPVSPMARPAAPPVEPPAPREPSVLALRIREMREAVSADVALHGFAYLGVLLTFVGVLGFLLFAFVDLPDAVQPVVELFIASVFFGWAFVLRRQEAYNVAKALELLGGAILPLILFAGLVDGAPIPPDVTGTPLVIVMPLVALAVAYAYARIARRRPETMLRHLVLPLVWLAALAAGFAFKTDEPLVSDAITRLVAPQPAMAAIAIAVTLLPAVRSRFEAADLPVMLPAVVAAPLVYALALGLSAGVAGPLALSATVAGVATLVSVRIVSLHHDQERPALLAIPVLLAISVIPVVPRVGLAAAGAVGAIAFLGLAAWFVREEIDDRETWLLAALGLLAGLGMSLDHPAAALVAFGAASLWIGRRRIAGVPVADSGPALTAAAAALPVGVGWGLWQLVDPAGAALALSAVLAAVVLLARRSGTDDEYWAWWPPAASVIVAAAAIAHVGLAPVASLTASGAAILVALALLALAIGAGPRYLELRLEAAVALAVFAMMPYVGVGWAGAIGVAGAVVVLERLVRVATADPLSWLVGILITIAGLLATFADPPAAVAAFGAASIWIHWKRSTGLPLEDVDELLAFAAGVLPFGFGWGVWFVLPPEAAVIVLSSLVTVLATVVRLRRVEDPFWQWWPIAPAVALVLLATAPVGLARFETITAPIVVSTLSSALAAITVMLGRGLEELRRAMAAALVVIATAPYVGVGWAGAFGTFVFIALVEVIIRSPERDELGSVVSSVAIVASLVPTLADPAAALAAFLAASIWVHWHRSAGIPVEGVDDLLLLAAAAFPVGLGWSLWQVLDPALAALTMAAVPAAAAGVARWRGDDDVFWQWWPGAAAAVVLVLSLGVIGLPASPPLDADTWYVVASLALIAATAALGTGFVVVRSWAFAAILLLDLQLLLDAAATTPTARAVLWSLLGLGFVAAATARTTPGFDHVAAIGHLLAVGAVVLALGPVGRAVAMAAWSVGLMIALIADQTGRGSAPRLVARLVATTPARSVVGWVVPVLLVVSVPIALLMSLNLWDTFADNRSWSGLITGGTAVFFAVVARTASWPREVRRPLTISAAVYVVVGVAVAAPVPWPSIIAAAMSIAVAVLVAPNIRSTALSWFAWLMSGVMFGLLGERAGLDADGLRLLVLAISVVYFVGGLTVDDRIAGRRVAGDGLRVAWLRFPVLLGALAVPGTLGSIMALEPELAPFAAFAAAAGYFGVAWLLRSSLITIPAFALAAFAVAALAPEGPADAPLLLPGVAAALLAVSLAVWMAGSRRDPVWDAWDTPPLIVAHGVALLALGLSALDTAPLPWIVIGGLSAAVGVWRRVRYWIDAGHLLVVVGAAFVGVGAVAAVLGLTSLRAMHEARVLAGWRRLVAHGVATLSAAVAWVLTVEWAGWAVDTATASTALVFGLSGLAVAVVASRSWIRQDTVASWMFLTGLGVGYSTLAVFITGPGEGSALLLTAPAVGVALFAVATQVARSALEEIPGYVPVVIASVGWPVLAVFAGFELGAAVLVSAWLGGGLALLAAEAVRRGTLIERSTAYVWGLVGFSYLVGAVVALADTPQRSLWATAIAGGTALVAGALARVANSEDQVVLRVSALGALELAILALLYGVGGGPGALVVAHLIVSTAGSLVLLVLGRRREDVSRWALPIGGLVAVSSVAAATAALQLLDDLRPITAVLLVVGIQAALIGIVWRRGEILTVAPAAVGAATLLLVAESATGIVQWYTLPVALVLLAEIELIGRYPIGRREDAAAPDLVWAEWLAIGLGVLPGVVDMFVRSLASSFLVFGFAALLLLWAVLTRVRRRAVAAAAVAVAAAVLVITAALAGAAPESSIFWILAVGLGFTVMSVAGVVEAMRSHRGFVVRRFDELMGDWR